MVVNQEYTTVWKSARINTFWQFQDSECQGNYRGRCKRIPIPEFLPCKSSLSRMNMIPVIKEVILELIWCIDKCLSGGVALIQTQNIRLISNLPGVYSNYGTGVYGSCEYRCNEVRNRNFSFLPGSTWIRAVLETSGQVDHRVLPEGYEWRTTVIFSWSSSCLSYCL